MLFLSYSYIAKEKNGKFYTGFGNCKLGLNTKPTTGFVYHDEYDDFEFLQAEAERHEKETSGFDMVTCTILFYDLTEVGI